MSGLMPNMCKSNFFTAGVDSGNQSILSGSLGFTLGSLPVKYLGVPLITKHFSFNNCVPLMECISDRIKAWNNIMLSYDGRLELVKIMLSAMSIYWCHHKFDISHIEKTMRNFLWSRKELSKHSKFSWKIVITTQQEEGIGIKRIKDWNQAFIAKSVWKLCSFYPTSLWKTWVTTNLIN